MAKDSAKRSVLARRKQELDHAVEHDFSKTAIARRAEKVRSAALAVIKKYRRPFAHLDGCPGNEEWKELTNKWPNFTTDEIMELARKWPPRPTLRDVSLLQ